MINFGRVVEVDIISARETIEIRNLRIIFDVQDQTGDEPASGRITIYNLNPKHRAAIRFEKLKELDRFGNTIRLKAGYINNVKQIYSGDIISAVNTKNGPDWITEIITTPEIARLLTANLTRDVPYPKGTLKADIFFDILGDLNIPVNNQEKSKILSILGTAPIKKSWTMFGSAADHLSRLSDQWRGMINVRYQGNRASLLTAGETINAIPIQINAGNLIGAIEVVDGGVKFKVQLDGDLTRNKLVFVKSETVDDLTTSGNYATTNINHRGDNREGNFATSCSCIFTNAEKGIFRTGLR